MTVSLISSKELISATAKCSRVREQTRILLEKIDEMRAELMTMGGFLALPPQMQEVPHGRIQEILTKYRAQDGATCKILIEESIKLYVGMVRVRIKENDDVLQEARVAVQRPVKEAKKLTKISPEVRRQELLSVIKRVESLHEELVRVAQPYMEVPAVTREWGTDAPTMPMDEEGQEAPVEHVRKNKRVAESLEPREDDEPLQKRRVGAPEETGLPITQETMRARLAGLEEETRRTLRDVQEVPGRERRPSLLAAILRRNKEMLGKARDFLREEGEARSGQELLEQIKTLETLQEELGKIITSDFQGDSPRHVIQEVAFLGESQRRVREATAPRFGDLQSLKKKQEKEERDKKIEDTVEEQKAIQDLVVGPKQKELQESLMERQSEEARSMRRFMTFSSGVGAAATFMMQDAVNIALAAASEGTFIEGAAAVAGALSNIHPATQIVAGVALSTTVAPRWDLTQTVVGVVVGVGTGIAFGPGAGFAAGTAVGEYGPRIVRRAGNAAAGIASPALRRYAKRKLMALFRQREEERAASLPHAP